MSQLKYWDGTAWVDAVIGAQGANGTQGLQGVLGPQGIQGIQGSTTSANALVQNAIVGDLMDIY